MLNIRLKFALILYVGIIIVIAKLASAQDLSVFEVVDNDSVGLTIADFQKWGMAIADIDRNGYPDIFCIRWKSPGHSRIYINEGGFFQDITDQSPLEQIESESYGNEDNTRTAEWVDYDNDGDKDLSFGTNLALHLFRNDDNFFTEVSQEMGFVGQIPPGNVDQWQYHVGGWADYDDDGDLDCVVSQYNNLNLYLFRNDGDHFTNVASEAGLDSTTLAEGGWSRTVTWTDFDLDGDPDLFSGRVNSAHFYRNDDGQFIDVTEEIGLGGLTDVSCREFFDYDNDGDLDFINVVGGESGSWATTTFFENRDGVYFDVNQEMGLGRYKDNYRSMTIGDFDNDGDQDVFINLMGEGSLDVLLINDETEDGVRVFDDVAYYAGITVTTGRKGAAFFDYDRDGFLDIYLPSGMLYHVLYHNLALNGANWVGFILEGTISNRDGVGSLVTIFTGDKKQIRYTKCGSGFLRQDNPWVHFGIGFATEIDSVVIRWPLGYKQVLTDVAINQYHEVKEPDYSAVETEQLSSKPHAFRLEQNYPNPFNPTTQIGYDLSRASDVRLTVYDVTGREIATLVNGRQAAGRYSVTWEGRDDQGRRVPSGVYVYQIQCGNFREAKKMVFVQ